MKSLRREYPLPTLLKLMGMSRSTYYYHEANPPSDRQATERPVIVEICEKSQFRYGYRRVAAALRKAAGIRIADKTVLKVMREEGLLCRTRRRRKYRSYMGQVGKSSPNLLARDFKAEDPMTKLVTDVTEFKVGGTKLYLSPVVDLYNDEVVAYSISRSPNMKMVLEMLAGLEGRLDGEGAPLLHSDMGWQYQMPAYRLALERMGIVQSMSRKGNCLDNAKAENFFSMVKTELYYDWEGDDPDVFERDLGRYIDWYNNVRIKKRLDGSSPVEYRLGRAAQFTSFDVQEMRSFTEMGGSSNDPLLFKDKALLVCGLRRIPM